MDPVSIHELSVPANKRALSRTDVMVAWLGIAVLAATILELLFKPVSLSGFQRISVDMSLRSFDLRFYVMLVGVFVSAFCLSPLLDVTIQELGSRWKSACTYASLAGICVFMGWFIIHFGRWQFGAWDFNILIDTGWRQVLGQQPYVDFVTPNPPGFNLGAKWAFELFGISWNAILYFDGIFACVTFLWIYRLMVALSISRFASMATAFVIECAGMLALCFWWYNSSALILAAIFFLSCLAYASRPRSNLAAVSYIVSLALLSLMKPNIAGTMIVGGIALLFVGTDRKLHLAVVTLIAGAVAVLLLRVNHVPVAEMLASYHAVANERGSVLARFGYHQMPPRERHLALLWIGILATPLLGVAPRLLKQLRTRDRKGIALSLFFSLSLLVALIGLSMNGEYRSVECTVLLAAGAVLSFGVEKNGPLLRRFFVALICASAVSDLYYGAVRIRVLGIGEHAYFEWQDNENRINSGFFRDMRVNSRMIDVQREVSAALKTNPGPFFLGPRLEYDYAVFGLRSPEHYPVYWQPGTSFGRSDQAHLVQEWKDDSFSTLIFQRFPEASSGPRSDSMNFTFYSDEFFDAINKMYVEDDTYDLIRVYHRRAVESAGN